MGYNESLRFETFPLLVKHAILSAAYLVKGTMSYSSRGRGRFFRPQRSASLPTSTATTHWTRYVHAAQPVAETASYQVTHSFADFGFEPELVEAVARRGYTVPTPIQDQAIPNLMTGRDVVGIANTGTGKTAAFLLPLINKVLLNSNQGVLILAPTRELAVQIFDELTAFAKNLPIGLASCIGGMNINNQINRLQSDPHFVVGTPGRIKDLIQRQAFKPELYTNVVLDEVDRMLDIGFRKDILFLISQLPAERQAALFSATMNAETEQIMARFLHQPVKVSVAKQVTAQHINQDVIKLKPGESKIDVLHQLLQQVEFEKVIVFGRTKHGINKLQTQLFNRGVRVSAIHGNKSQNARLKSLQDLKQGRVKVLLATDVAARGIDVDGVTHVINFDEPTTYDDYVHRIGRTGRAGKVGQALTFVME